MTAMSKDQVLVVDDEKEICFLLSDILKKIGFDVSSANSMTEGRKMLKKKSYKLIFIDLGLPDGMGFNLFKNINLLDEHIKVVVITAFGGDTERSRARSEGAHSFIDKPFNKATIMRTLSEFNMAP